LNGGTLSRRWSGEGVERGSTAAGASFAIARSLCDDGPGDRARSSRGELSSDWIAGSVLELRAGLCDSARESRGASEG
jgi:hypothetical protein